MKKNRILMLLLSFALIIGTFAGCGTSASKNKVSADDKKAGKRSIVCTSYPQYDWVKQVLGDKIKDYDVTLLIGEGVDLHSYQPSASDVAKISTADIFIYVGGESDGWVTKALKSAVNKKMQVINMLDVLGDRVKEEEVVDGMQHSEHHHDDGDDGEKHEDEYKGHDHSEKTAGVEYDEHVWLSLKNAKLLVKEIEKDLEVVDSKNKDTFKQNANSYIEKLNKLDGEYTKAVENGNKKTVVFGDRFPFRYLVNDYNIKYYAAFVGCSAETEASFKTISFLANKVDEENLNTILVIENSDEKIAKTIKNNTKSKDQKILVMDSLQSITNDELKGDYSYLKAMENNLKTLKEALQ